MKEYEWVEYTDLTCDGQTIITTRLLEKGTWRIILEKRTVDPPLTVVQCAGRFLGLLAQRQGAWKRRSCI